MAQQRRSPRLAIAIALVILVLAALGAYYYFFVKYAYVYVKVPLQKDDVRDCINSLRDQLYDYTTPAQCDTLWPGEKEKCLAWISGSPASCTNVIDDTDRAWCYALASRNPSVCDSVGFGKDYCKAFVTRDASKCAQVADEALHGKCELTIGDETSGAFTQAEHICGTEEI